MTYLIEQLKKDKVSPKKSWGQVFLVDNYALAEIIKLCQLQNDDVVVEIGAGTGFLTILLAERAKRIYALEWDRTLVALLRTKLKKAKVKVIRDNALGFDYEKLAREEDRKLKIVGNLPYQISVPLIFKLLKGRNYLESMYLMVQKEVADRILASPGTKSYGILSLSSQIYARTSLLLSVKKTSFFPQPKVDSTLVKFNLLKDPLVKTEEEGFLKMVIKAAFSQRRKTLLNALKGANFNISSNNILKACELGEIDSQRRGETLNLEEFKGLSKQLFKLGCFLPAEILRGR